MRTLRVMYLLRTRFYVIYKKRLESCQAGSYWTANLQ